MPSAVTRVAVSAIIQSATLQYAPVGIVKLFGDVDGTAFLIDNCTGTISGIFSTPDTTMSETTRQCEEHEVERIQRKTGDKQAYMLPTRFRPPSLTEIN